MREIKFRAWDKEANHMYYNSGHIIIDMKGHCFNLQTGGQSEPLLFTGLHDKNGKEIYEGDIVEHFNGVQVVEWCEDNASFQMNLNDNVFDQELFWDGLKVEIIGNIYENPDLLGGTQKGPEN